MEIGTSATSPELHYQAERAAQIQTVRPTPDYIIDRYRRCRHHRLFPKEYLFRSLRDRGAFTGERRILDFGCGEGTISTQLAILGARVTAVDISGELIDIAKKRAALDKVNDRIDFLVCDVAQSPLPKNAFDFAVCNAALHHVDLGSVLPRIFASLKPGGILSIAEPIALSPFLSAVRNVVPIEKDASPDERQLDQGELDFIRRGFASSSIVYFNLFGRLSRLLPHANQIDRGHPITRMILLSLLALDRSLLSLFPSLYRFCGVVVVIGEKQR